MLRAAFIPLTPPPITKACEVTGTKTLSIGSNFLAFATAIRTKSLAFSVASSGLFIWTQEHWSLILAISKRKGLSPASFKDSLKRGSWVLGLQEATTTLFSLYSWMSSLILIWVSWEQV